MLLARLQVCVDVGTAGKDSYMQTSLRIVNSHCEATKEKAGGMANGTAWDAEVDPEADFDTFKDKAKETLLENADAAEHLPELRKSMWKDPLQGHQI